MSKLDVPFFKQDKEYTCGPTSLQMVFAYYGKRASEAALAEALGTNDDSGTRKDRMQQLATALGFHCYVNNGSTLEELQYLISLSIPPIVRFIEPDEDEDHYGVVVSIDDETLIIHDPWNGPDQVYDREEFFDRWLCRKWGTCKQWLMAVAQEPLPLGHQFHPNE
ncbi:MAG: C39 family peptidase [Candidatus Kaiserbacteria bacterium]|nr:C39 family peptidase [Candidatus Kaiserbacteria bacterium]MCB9816811.1 C39 family peptidase [Candidatus Nomurabacteria bacterium]